MYKTRFGAFISIIAYVLIIAFAIKNGQKLVQRTSPTIINTNEIIDVQNDQELHNLADNDVTIMVLTQVAGENEGDPVAFALPERVARILTFQSEIPSSSIDRYPYNVDGFSPPDEGVI